MFRTSERWKNAVKYGAQVVSYVDIVDYSGQYVVSNLPIVSGTVTIDRTRAVRRECNIVIQDKEGALVPNEINSILQPLSSYYMRIYRGFRYRNGEEEVVPLGTFAPWNPKISETPESLQISVQGLDRSKIVTLIRWTEPYVIQSGTNTGAAIRDAMLSRMSGLTMAFRPTKTTTPLVTFGLDTQADPWKDITGLASADGMDLYFDANDVLRLEPVLEDVDSVIPVATLGDDLESIVTKFDRSNNADQQYTGVIVRSESAEINPPIHVEVWRPDTPYRIPYFLVSSFIKTYEQAVAAGVARLRVSGRGEVAVQLSIVPDPSLEVDDVIRVISQRSKLNDSFMIKSMSIPLDPESGMTVDCSERRMG